MNWKYLHFWANNIGSHQVSDKRNLSGRQAPTDRGCQGKTPPDADQTGTEANCRRSEEMLS